MDGAIRTYPPEADGFTMVEADEVGLNSLRPRVIKTPRLNEGNASISEADKRNMK